MLPHRGTHCSLGPVITWPAGHGSSSEGSRHQALDHCLVSPGSLLVTEPRTRYTDVVPSPGWAACPTSNPDTTRVTAGFVPVATHLKGKTRRKWDPLPTLSQHLYFLSWASELQSRIISQNQCKEPQDLKDSDAKLVHLWIIMNDPLLVYM